MSTESRFRIESKGMFAGFLFYAIVGVICVVVLPLVNYPPHIGIIGLFSLITAYGLLRRRSWTVWFVAILFFVATTFTVYTFYYIVWSDVVVAAIMILYLILSWAFTIYVTARRSVLES